MRIKSKNVQYYKNILVGIYEGYIRIHGKIGIYYSLIFFIEYEVFE
jgi:hypothetical protein